MSELTKSSKNNGLQLIFLLFIGLVLGLIFLFALPPWQHYDEPNHFEYVWLAANQNHLPRPGDYNRELSQQVMISMGRNRFWGEKNEITYQPEEQVVIQGYSQLHEPPFYYLAASIPLRFLRQQPVEIQLYAARLVSLIFYLITIFAAWATARELTPDGKTYHWLLPLSMIFLPAFTDLMTAVNSDAAAVAVASLFIWISVRMLKRGFSLLDFLGLTFLGGLTIFTKNTAMFVLGVYPLVLLFSIMRHRWRGLVWASIILALVAILAGVLLTDEPLYWLRASLQPEAMRLEDRQAVHGSFVFCFYPGNGKSPDWWPLMAQSIPGADTMQLAGKEVDLGFWAWGDQPAAITSPIVHTNDNTFSTKINIDTSPRFFSLSFKIPETTDRIWLTFNPKPDQKGVSVFLDGLVLVEGNPNLMQEPVFQEMDGSQVLWGENLYKNWLRNASAEQASFRFKPMIDQYGARFLPDGMMPSLLLGALIDYRGMQYVHITAAERMFRSFWGKFAWGHIGYMGWSFLGRPYFWLAIFSALGLLGVIIALVRKWKQLDKTLLIVLWLLLVIAWGFNFLRGVPYVVYPKLYLSVARHVYPVIIPTMLFFVVGWVEIIRVLVWASTGFFNILKVNKTVLEKLSKGICFVSYGALLFVWFACTLGALISILSYYKIL